MARPRQYHSSAERQAAYRKRLKTSTAIVPRQALEQHYAKLETLQQTIQEAAAKGNTFAAKCTAASWDTTVDKLIHALQNYAEN